LANGSDGQVRESQQKEAEEEARLQDQLEEAKRRSQIGQRQSAGSGSGRIPIFLALLDPDPYIIYQS